MQRIALILAIIGSAIGLICSIIALATVGSDPAYSTRIWVGWMALLLAVVPSIALLLLRRRPIIASLIMLVSGLGGFVCINLFYINTWYALAIPFWIAATVLAIISSRAIVRRRPRPMRLM